MKIEYTAIGFVKAKEEVGSRKILQKPEGNNREVEIIIEEKYAEALQDLNGFEYVYIIFDFHKSEKSNLKSNPPWVNREIGTFATRSPNRPNSIGLSTVKLISVSGNIITISNADMINGTPVIDIKPYIPDIDAPTNKMSGWIKDADRL